MQRKQLWTALLVTVFLGTSTHAAHAGYTVIDDDLFPSSAVAPTRFEPRSAGLSRMSPRLGDEQQQYPIPFAKYYSSLSATARAKLDELIPEMQGARVHIVGRSDATTYTGGKLASLSQNRANMIRSYLLRKGIPASAITLEVDKSPNPQPNGALYPSDLYISQSERYYAIPVETASYVPQPKYQAMPSQQMPASSTPAIAANTDARTIEYINQAVQSGQMSPAVAVKLIQYISDSSRSNAASARFAVMQPTPQNRPEATKVIAEPVLTQSWTLDKKLTLRDNIDAWSKLAGWKPPQWDASNYYQVTVTTTLDGGFPDILRQVADATGLNICAKKREKYVRVTDSNVSCK